MFDLWLLRLGNCNLQHHLALWQRLLVAGMGKSLWGSSCLAVALLSAVWAYGLMLRGCLGHKIWRWVQAEKETNIFVEVYWKYSIRYHNPIWSMGA